MDSIDYSLGFFTPTERGVVFTMKMVKFSHTAAVRGG